MTARLATRFLATAAIVSVGIAAASSLSRDQFVSRALYGAQEDYIAGPPQWVPFTMEYSIRGKDEHKYIQWRASNGSTRTEVLQDPHSRAPTITIDNVPARAHYRLHNGRWYHHPLRFQQNGGKPFTVLKRSRISEVGPTDPRLQPLWNMTSDLTLYEFKAPSGSIGIFAREINLLPLYMTYASQGKVRQVTRLEIGEPKVEFAPPAGVTPELRQDAQGAGGLDRLPSSVAR